MDKEKLKNYKEKSEALAKKVLQLKSIKEKVEEKFKPLIDSIKSEKIEVAALEQELKDQGLEEYKLTKLKKLTGGFSVTVSKDKIVTFDKEEAFKWAKEHDMCLVLDENSFIPIAKTQKFDFVKIEDKITICKPKVVVLEEE